MMTRSFDEIRQRLEDERDRLRESIQTREDEVLQYADRQANDHSGYSNHLADSGSSTFEMQKDLALARNSQTLLDDVERALERIDTGSYGICERCGRAAQQRRGVREGDRELVLVAGRARAGGL